jgi:DNA processing protein
MGGNDEAVSAERGLAYLVLTLTVGVGPVTIRRAVARAFGVLGVMKFSAGDWAEIDGVGQQKAARIIADLERARREAEQVVGKCGRLGIARVTPEDAMYPILLRDLDDSPAVLYVRGTLEPRDLNAVAIVGSRGCSMYGREQATRLAGQLAGNGFTLVSGGARGIDSAAHEGALRTETGRTIAVLGCGVDVVYPPENEGLFERILERGALVSAYPPGTPAIARQFLQRNRVISGLSRGVIVVEADEKSGAMTTARCAADDHNRPVFAVPGRIDNPLSAGPHKLIREGAVLTRGMDDVLEGLGPLPDAAHRLPAGSAAKAPAGVMVEAPLDPPRSPVGGPEVAASLFAEDGLTASQGKLRSALRTRKEASADELIDLTELAAGVVSRDLTLLAIRGLVARTERQTYVWKGK